MQSLWSRAGQAHQCSRRVCETAVTTLGRRVTTAAVRGRKPTFAEVFTACYSSLFATAAVVDAIRKEDRRQDLDRQLEETRREVAELQLLQALEAERRNVKSLNQDHPQLTPDQVDQLWKTLKEVYIGRPFMQEMRKPIRPRHTTRLLRFLKNYYNVRKTTLDDLRMTDYERLERAIMDEEMDPAIRRRTPQTRRQLHNDFKTVKHVVNQLLDRAEAHDRSRSDSPSFDQARVLASSSTSAYTYESIDSAGARDNRHTLNQRLRGIVNSTHLGLKEMVGRVCYNMLIASHPPDMHTFNTLIVGFTKRNNHNLAEALVDSFFYRRRIIPTPSTYVAILHHYRETNNHGRFFRAISRIVGLDEEIGAKLGRRHIHDVTQGLTSKEWVVDRGYTHTGDWVWAMFPIDRPLLEALIKGLVHFRVLDQAVAVFISCMQANIRLSTRIVQHLFDECLWNLDWKAAVDLVRGITKCQNSLASQLLDQNSALARQLYYIVDLCGLNSSVHEVSNSMVRNLGISYEKLALLMEALARAGAASESDWAGFEDRQAKSKLDDARKASISRVLQIESLSTQIEKSKKATQLIECTLLGSEDLSLEFRASTAGFLRESYQQHRDRKQASTGAVKATTTTTTTEYGVCDSASKWKWPWAGLAPWRRGGSNWKTLDAQKL
ncbi:hypothetical protein BGZ63DRAFT_392520 [Mariannaea sp. PMI_226]|nr:hypothetical protein BGZ63DRAFT_392520 [Mariannaea sp. PMI_226]